MKKLPTLKGYLVVNLFYESSTRTSSSFELAAKRLSADTLTVKSAGSSVDKGESLKDTALTLGAYDPDVIVMRHPQIGAPQLVARVTGAHVVNAGDGKHQHPTQALLDLYTLQQELGRLDGLHVAIVGDVLHSRVARSLVQAFELVGVRCTLVGPPALLPRDLRAEATSDIGAIADADVVYVLRMQSERMQAGANYVPSLREYTERWGITPERIRPGQKVMHPGPMNRGVEIDPRVADSPDSLVEAQVRVGARRAHGRPVRRADRRPGRRTQSRRRRGGVMLYARERDGANVVFRGARVVDPAEDIDATLDVRVDDGVIVAIGEQVDANGHRVVDAAGLVLAPAFVDPHVHLRTPGREDEETIASGTAAAAAGGYCAILAMPNTDPVVDSAATLGSLVETAKREAEVSVGFLAAITRGQAGEELTEMGRLADAGAAGFTDDGMPVVSAGMLRRALQYASTTGRPLALHCEEPSLSRGGHVHEGAVAAELGFAAYPSVGESVMVERDLALAAYEDQPVHLMHLSAAESVAALRRAREAGVRASGEVTPHHLVLTDEAVRTLDPNVKMNPPLRAERTASHCSTRSATARSRRSRPTTRRTRGTRRTCPSRRRRSASRASRRRSPCSTPSSSSRGSCRCRRCSSGCPPAPRGSSASSGRASRSERAPSSSCSTSRPIRMCARTDSALALRTRGCSGGRSTGAWR